MPVVGYGVPRDPEPVREEQAVEHVGAGASAPQGIENVQGMLVVIAAEDQNTHGR